MESWKTLTNKMVYSEQVKCLPPPRVEVTSVSQYNYKNAWKRLDMYVLESPIKEISFMLVHNKLPTKERTFRVGISPDPVCHICPGRVNSNAEHFFCGCVRVGLVWARIKTILVQLIGENVCNWKLINYLMPVNNNEKEVVWLLGNYIWKCWKDLFSHPQDFLKEEEFFGFLRFKFRNDQQGARERLNDISSLLL